MDISFKKLPGHLLNEFGCNGGIGAFDWSTLKILFLSFETHQIFGSENECCIDMKNNKIMYKKSFK